MIINRSAVCEVCNYYEMEVNQKLVDLFNGDNHKMMKYVSEENELHYTDITLAEFEELASIIIKDDKPMPEKYCVVYTTKAWEGGYEHQYRLCDLMEQFIEENIYDYFVDSEPLDGDYDVEDTIEDD